MFSEVFSDGNFGRFDAEFFGKEFVFKERLLNSKNHKSIGSLATVTDGEHGSPDLDENSGIIYLSGNNVKDNVLDFGNIRYCSLKLHQKNLRSELQKNSVLMSIVGTVGKASVICCDVLGNTDRNVATIKKISSELNPYFLSTFLNSRLGYFQTQRFSTGNVQPLLNLQQVRSIIVPIFSQLFQLKIEKLVKNAHLKLEQSKSLYAQAEALLLETIGLTNFTPSPENISIQSFKDSFGTSGRLDAEYYQPKYKDWAQTINDYKHGSATLANVCEVKDKNFTPTDDKTYSYIELSDIDKVGGIAGATTSNGAALPTRARRLVKPGDVLVSSIEGSLSSCAIASEKYNDALCSTGFYVLRSSKINAETLLAIMKSTPIQSLLKQGCSGTILTAINNESFLKLPIPLIDAVTQQNIAAQIQESFKFKAESERLLEVAKRAVEIAIEQDEQAGLHYIDTAAK